MHTDDLIHRLASNVRPVRRLRPPSLRTMWWCVAALPWVIAVAYIAGLRPDIAEQLQDRHWLIEQAAAFATALTAAGAAFCAGVPGRPIWERYVPLLPLTIWLTTLGQGCVEESISIGRTGFALYPDWQCLPEIVVVGFGPAVVMAIMIYRGSPVAPIATAALGGLAAGALAEVGFRVFHQQDASLMILVWETGTVFGLALIAGLLGPRVLRWRLRDNKDGD